MTIQSINWVEKEKWSAENAPWYKQMSERISGYENAYFASKCGKWKSEWNDFAMRKLRYLLKEIENRISEFGPDDYMTRLSREKANSFMAHMATVNEIAKSMPALAEEMFYHSNLCQMKAFA